MHINLQGWIGGCTILSRNFNAARKVMEEYIIWYVPMKLLQACAKISVCNLFMMLPYPCEVLSNAVAGTQNKWEARIWGRPVNMVTSRHGNVYRIAGPLWETPIIYSPYKGAVMRNFDFYFVVVLNALCKKQTIYRWFDTPWRSWDGISLIAF